MKYIKLFENFDTFEKSLLNDIKDIFIELEDDGFDININTSNSLIEIEIKKKGFIGLSFDCKPFLFKYEDVSDYLKRFNDYIDYSIKDYINKTVISQKRNSVNKKYECTWSRFIFLEEKFVNREVINRINSDENKFTFIKLEFKYKKDIKSFERHEIINEVRVPREERVQLYKDDNIIVIVPLTHRALKKYAIGCKWCINSDYGEWEDYHKGNHVIIIQRKAKVPIIGITNNQTSNEIFWLAKWDNNESSFEDVCEILDYEFRNDRTMSDYYLNLTKDINNFSTNIVYYSPSSGSVYDMEDNLFANFNLNINDVPNVNKDIIEIIGNYFS